MCARACHEETTPTSRPTAVSLIVFYFEGRLVVESYNRTVNAVSPQYLLFQSTNGGHRWFVWYGTH